MRDITKNWVFPGGGGDGKKKKKEKKKEVGEEVEEEEDKKRQRELFYIRYVGLMKKKWQVLKDG